MKLFYLIAILFLPFITIGQKTTEYFANGKVDNERKTDSKSGIETQNFYFETGELRFQGIYSSNGLLQDYFSFNEKGDTIKKSKIPIIKAQPKIDLGFIKWNYVESGIGYCYINKGKGAKIKEGDSITIKYIGYFEDGSQFDNTDITGDLLNVKIGEAYYLKSFQAGLKLFKRRQKGFIKIPSELAYGDQPMGNIPANSTLIYEIEIK